MDIINVAANLIISISLIAVPICIIIGIVVGVSGSQTDDVAAKKRRKKKAWNIVLYPIVIAIFLVVMSGLLNIILQK